MKWLLLAIFLSVLGVASVARADDLPQSYEIRDAVKYGVVAKLHEDDRGIYYWGVYQWNDPQYDSDYEAEGILGFMKPQGPEGHLLYGTDFEGELNGARQPLFNLADSEIAYFNSVLLPRIRAAAPWVEELGSIEMRGYALGTHFRDSENFIKTRADHRILPEEPLFGISWRRNDQGRYVPHYEVTGDAGIAVADWPYEVGNRTFWTTVAAARKDRVEQNALTRRGAVVAQQPAENPGASNNPSSPTLEVSPQSEEVLREYWALMSAYGPSKTPTLPPEQRKRLSSEWRILHRAYRMTRRCPLAEPWWVETFRLQAVAISSVLLQHGVNPGEWIPEINAAIDAKRCDDLDQKQFYADSRRLAAHVHTLVLGGADNAGLACRNALPAPPAPYLDLIKQMAGEDETIATRLERWRASSLEQVNNSLCTDNAALRPHPAALMRTYQNRKGRFWQLGQPHATRISARRARAGYTPTYSEDIVSETLSSKGLAIVKLGLDQQGRWFLSAVESPSGVSIGSGEEGIPLEVRAALFANARTSQPWVTFDPVDVEDIPRGKKWIYDDLTLKIWIALSLADVERENAYLGIVAQTTEGGPFESWSRTSEREGGRAATIAYDMTIELSLSRFGRVPLESVVFAEEWATADGPVGQPMVNK